MAEININKAFLEEIRSVVDTRSVEALRSIFEEVHPTDIAEILMRLPKDDAIFVFSNLDEESAAEALTFIDEDDRQMFMQLLTPTEIAEKVIDNLDSDDAADIISALPEDQQMEVLSKITDFEQAKDIADLLNYDEDTAGGLMAKELVKVNISNTMIQCVREIRKQAEDLDDLYAIYVVDDRDVLVGLLPLKRLLLAPTNSDLSKIIDKNVVSVRTNTKREEVSNIMEKYDIVVIPVVDDLGRLLGRITIDDVVDVMKEEAERDYQLASGISEDVEADDAIWVQSRARLPWLFIGLLGGIVGSRIIGMHEQTLMIHPEMAFFIPLIAAMGGNVGVQSSAIIVQSLANNSIESKSLYKRLAKELGVGLISALACAVLLLGYSLAFADNIAVSLTVSISLFVVILFASLMGTTIPLLLDKIKIDPALATGPFITTGNDLSGMFIYFMIGRLLYGVF